MKRNRSKNRRETIQVWTYEQARQVVPYITSIMTSLREHRLEAQQHQAAAARVARQYGRPQRADLIAQDDAIRDFQRAEDRFHEALEELHALDIYCLEPLQGLALIPFAKGDQLAWFVFDLFGTDKLGFWRYHQDSLETRRPIAEALAGPSDSASVVI
jgi:hypothetical protein